MKQKLLIWAILLSAILILISLSAFAQYDVLSKYSQGSDIKDLKKETLTYSPPTEPLGIIIAGSGTINPAGGTSGTGNGSVSPGETGQAGTGTVVYPRRTRFLGATDQRFINAAKQYIEQKLGKDYYNKFISFDSGSSYEDCIQDNCTVRNEIIFTYNITFETDGPPELGPPLNIVYVTIDDKGTIVNYRGPSKSYQFLISKDKAIAKAKSYGLKNITEAGIVTASGTNGYEIVWAVSSKDLAGDCRDIGRMRECIYKGVYVDVDTGEIRGEYRINPLILTPSGTGGVKLGEFDEKALYVTVIEQAGNAARVLTNAKVTLAYSIGEEQSMPAEWKDVAVDNRGNVIFSNVQPGDYTITAKAPSYISAQKEFTKQAGVAGHISISLTKAPEGAVGSIKIALLKRYAPQTKEYIKNGKIAILKDGKIIRSSGTENGEILFSNLPIGTYIASASAPGYKSEQREFNIEVNVEGWLPIDLEEAFERDKSTICPKDCTCDEQTNIVECHGKGFGEKGIAMSIERAIKTVKDRDIIDEFDYVEVKESEEKVSYEIGGAKNGRLLFFIPVQMNVKTSVNAKTSMIEKVEKPWWSFLFR